MNKKVAIVDYQLGNLFSVRQACLYFGVDAVITSNPDVVAESDYLILPGVGAFTDAMKNMDNLGLSMAVKDYINSGKNFMGVCLGLQLLFSESEEFGSSSGLGIIEGLVKKFNPLDDRQQRVKIPQINWNKIARPITTTWEGTPLADCKENDYMYFVHSYYVHPESEKDILTMTTYGDQQYCSSVFRDNIFACQFHPEKSGVDGLKIYKLFLNIQ